MSSYRFSLSHQAHQDANIQRGLDVRFALRCAVRRLAAGFRLLLTSLSPLILGFGVLPSMVSEAPWTRWRASKKEGPSRIQGARNRYLVSRVSAASVARVMMWHPRHRVMHHSHLHRLCLHLHLVRGICSRRRSKVRRACSSTSHPLPLSSMAWGQPESVSVSPPHAARGSPDDQHSRRLLLSFGVD
jgi:hypothetical protein